MKKFFAGYAREPINGALVGQRAFELPHRERVRCPDCLEPSLDLSEAEVLLDACGEVRMVYRATCSSCGFSVQRDESYGVPLMAVLDAIVMLDVRLAT